VRGRVGGARYGRHVTKRPPILHVDADAFFAGVAQRDRPELASRPFAVVAHMYVASGNYLARAQGVRGGDLVSAAQRKCPGLALVELDTAANEAASEALHDLLRESAVAFEPGSMEEGFLDVGAIAWAEAIRIGERIRERAVAEIGITVSVGVGSTKLMAKLASRTAKPDGLHVIDPDVELRLRAELAVADVWGIGEKTLRRLDELGVRVLRDVDALDDVTLERACGVGMARRLRGIRAGTDDASVRPIEERDSLSASAGTRAYGKPDRTPSQLVELCVQRVVRRATRADLVATGIALHLEPLAGAAITRRASSVEATDDEAHWLGLAQQLLRDDVVPRLGGLRVTLTGLISRSRGQQALF
jgi:DNA polymerase IV